MCSGIYFNVLVNCYFLNVSVSQSLKFASARPLLKGKALPGTVTVPIPVRCPPSPTPPRSYKVPPSFHLHPSQSLPQRCCAGYGRGSAASSSVRARNGSRHRSSGVPTIARGFGERPLKPECGAWYAVCSPLRRLQRSTRPDEAPFDRDRVPTVPPNRHHADRAQFLTVLRHHCLPIIRAVVK